MHLSIPAGATSKIVAFPVFDSSSAVGATLAGLVYNSGSLTAYYNRTGASGAAVSMALATMTKGTWVTLGFVAVDGTNLPGWYELGVPDAALAAGCQQVQIMLKGATNMVPVCIEIELTAVSNQDAVRGGMTALPNANAEAAGGLYTRGTSAGQINQPANGRIDVNTVAINQVATTSVTTINANQGQTQPINFTGTGATAYVKSDLTQILATGVSTPATAGILDVNVKNMNNVAATSITTINANQGETQPINFTGTGATAYVKTDIISAAGTAWGSGAITENSIASNAIAATKIATGAVTNATFAAGAIDAAAIADAAIDIATFAADVKTGTYLNAQVKGEDNIDFGALQKASLNAATPASVTGAVGSIGAGGITDASFAAATYPKALRTATAQSGAAGYIQLDASAGATDNIWVGCSIKIVSGTGVGQARTIIMYVASTQRAYVDKVWATNPANDSVFVINVGKLTVDVLTVGIAAAGASTTITLSAPAVATNEYYDGAIVLIVSGTGLGQSRVISGYVGSTKVATVSDAWAVAPDNTSVYVVQGLGDVEVGVNNDKTGYSIAANGIGVTAIATDAINAASVKADAVTKIQTGLATPTNITAGTITTVTNLTNAPTGMALDSTVAKEATLTTKIPTALSFTGANVNAESKVTVAPTDMALNSTVAKDATVSKPATAQTIITPTELDALYAAFITAHAKQITPPVMGASLASKIEYIYGLLTGQHTTDAVSGLTVANIDGDTIGAATVSNPTPTSTRRGKLT